MHEGSCRSRRLVDSPCLVAVATRRHGIGREHIVEREILRGDSGILYGSSPRAVR